jgi:CRP-like cAMP-binding protein
MKPDELERHYTSGQLILERGSETRSLFVVRAGSVVLDRDDGSDPCLIGSGQVFGELGAVLGSPSPYRALADDDVTVLVLEAEVLNRLCKDSPEFSVRLVRHLADELETAHGDRAALGGVDQRLAQGYKSLVPVLFASAIGDEMPAPVEGRLTELAGRAELTVLDAYFCIQRLLESRVLRLIDDQLAIVEPQQLEALRDT